MNGQQLYLWRFSKEERKNCKVVLDTIKDCVPLICCKIYDEDQDQKLDTIYLIYK